MSPELLIALLAGVVLGASAHRAGLCTVKAVAEVITSRRAHVLWSFTSTALCAAGPLPLAPCAHPGLLWAVSGAALLTVFGSALWRGSFRVRRPRWQSSLRHFAGGLAMGAGAALIPGGNDGLILFGIPALSPHALPIWAAIVLGVALSLTVMRRAGLRVPRINCEGDICRSTL